MLHLYQLLASVSLLTNLSEQTLVLLRAKSSLSPLVHPAAKAHVGFRKPLVAIAQSGPIGAEASGARYQPPRRLGLNSCYSFCVFNLGKSKTAGDWIAHAVLGVVALILIWWMMHMFL